MGGEPEPLGREIENLDFSNKCHKRGRCYRFSFASQAAFP